MFRICLLLCVLVTTSALAQQPPPEYSLNNCQDDGGYFMQRKMLWSNDHGTYCGWDMNTAAATGACLAGQYVNNVTTGSINCGSPAFTELTGTISPSQLPAPTSTARGGVSGTGSSLACPTGQWVSSLSASGAIQCSAPVATATFNAAPASVSRSLNTNYSFATTTFVAYTYRIACSASLAGGQDWTVELRSDSASTPTTARGTVGSSNSVAIAIALTVSNGDTKQIVGFVPGGQNLRLVPVISGTTCTITTLQQTEWTNTVTVTVT